MYHSVEFYLSWSGTLHMWARSAVEILLWFWVVSGAIFVLRFLVFVLTEQSIGPSVLAVEVTPLKGAP
jgi:hypothetical protein